MRNIELKARLRDRAHALRACAAIGARPQGDIHQVDTYFPAPEGRLKLREANPGRDELVFYRRPDTAGPKGCEYALQEAAPGMRAFLTKALGELCAVDKVRTLWLWENVRIHLDAVAGLGDFIEFEAVMEDDTPDAEGYAKLDHLIAAFGLTDGDHLTHSYLDMMLSGKGRQPA